MHDAAAEQWVPNPNGEQRGGRMSARVLHLIQIGLCCVCTCAYVRLCVWDDGGRIYADNTVEAKTRYYKHPFAVMACHFSDIYVHTSVGEHTRRLSSRFTPMWDFSLLLNRKLFTFRPIILRLEPLLCRYGLL